MSVRPVQSVITGHRQTEGGGFVVRRPFPTGGLEHFDPFLLLDEMGPVDYAPGEAVGAPDHPHRGFQTVSYILSGELAHADSAGNAGSLGPGDVQWMHAGAGVVHREMPSRRMQVEGGRMHGFQVWVNLPRSQKMTPPQYQEIQASSIPEAHTADGLAQVRVIAGQALGVQAVIQTATPITYQHWTLRPGASVQVPIPEDQRAGVYVFQGSATVAGRVVAEGQLAVLGEGETVGLAASGDAQLLLLAGVPLGEPIAWAGPFVMNTRGEVRQAMIDYQEGRLGRIPPTIVRAF